MHEDEKVAQRRERRKYPRLDKIIKMRYQRLEDLSEKAPYGEGEILDISSGGLRFLAGQPIEINSELVVVLEFPGWLSADDNLSYSGKDDEISVLQALGKVLRVQASQSAPGRYEIGVQFSSRLQGKEI